MRRHSIWMPTLHQAALAAGRSADAQAAPSAATAVAQVKLLQVALFFGAPGMYSATRPKAARASLTSASVIAGNAPALSFCVQQTRFIHAAPALLSIRAGVLACGRASETDGCFAHRKGSCFLQLRPLHLDNLASTS